MTQPRARPDDGGTDELAQPRPLPVPAAPGEDGVAQVVQLHAALVLPAPRVRQRPAELGVPEQRRQVLQDDGHADVVHRRVGDGADGPVGQRSAAEHPHVSGAGQLDGLVEGERARGGPAATLRTVRLWKLLGVAGLAGVAATGAVLVRNERQRRAYTPDDVRARLHERYATLAENRR